MMDTIGKFVVTSHATDENGAWTGLYAIHSKVDTGNSKRLDLLMIEDGETTEKFSDMWVAAKAGRELGIKRARELNEER
jgi:hypothetical protein